MVSRNRPKKEEATHEETTLHRGACGNDDDHEIIIEPMIAPRKDFTRALIATSLAWSFSVVFLYEVRWFGSYEELLNLVEATFVFRVSSLSDIPYRLAVLIGGIIVFSLIQIAIVSVGIIVLPWVGVRTGNSPFFRCVLAYLMGFGTTGLMVLGLALPGLLFRVPFIVLVICGGVVFWRKGRALLSLALQEIVESIRSDRLTQGLFLTSISLMALALPTALAPETDFVNDSLIYHLPIAARAERLHKLVPLQHNFRFSFPALVELIRSVGFLLHGEVAAKLLNWFVTGATALTLALLSVRRGGKACGWFIAALYLGNSMVFSYMTNSKNDPVLCLFGLGTILCLLQYRSSGRYAWAALIGLLLGFQCGVKYTVGVILGIPILVGVLLCGCSAKRWTGLALALMGLVLPFVPWLLRNYLEIGNPVHPFFGEAFGGMSLSPKTENVLIELGRGIGQNEDYRTWLGKLTAPWLMCFSDGFNPVWLVTLPLAFLCFRLKDEYSVWMAVSVGGFIAWLLSRPNYHYLFPIVAIAMVPVGVGLWHAAQSGFRKSVIILGGVLLLSELYHVARSPLLLHSLQAGVGLEEPQAYFERKFTTYAQAQAAVRQHTSAESGVLFVGEVKSYPVIRYRKILVNSGVESFQVYPLIRRSRTANELWRRLKQLRITHVLHNQTTAIFLRDATAHFPWTKRDVHVWAECWRQHAVLRYVSPKMDIDKGWFVLYALVDQVDVPATLTLPGIESMLYVFEKRFEAQKWKEYYQNLPPLRDDLDRYANFQFFMGRIALAERALMNAQGWFEKAESQGLLTPGLFENLAELALARGDMTSALRYFQKIAATHQPVPKLVQEYLARAKGSARE